VVGVIKIFTNLALFLLAAVVVLFIVANRGIVEVNLWPLPYLVDLPLYLVFFIGLFAGILLAGAIGMVRRARSFARARRAEKEARRLQTEVDALEQELDADGGPEKNTAPVELPRLPPDVP
jgi:uncharacterized integral membrane protein